MANTRHGPPERLIAEGIAAKECGDLGPETLLDKGDGWARRRHFSTQVESLTTRLDDEAYAKAVSEGEISASFRKFVSLVIQNPRDFRLRFLHVAFRQYRKDWQAYKKSLQRINDAAMWGDDHDFYAELMRAFSRVLSAKVQVWEKECLVAWAETFSTFSTSYLLRVWILHSEEFPEDPHYFQDRIDPEWHGDVLSFFAGLISDMMRERQCVACQHFDKRMEHKCYERCETSLSIRPSLFTPLGALL